MVLVPEFNGEEEEDADVLDLCDDQLEEELSEWLMTRLPKGMPWKGWFDSHRTT